MKSLGNKKLWCHLSVDNNNKYTNREIRLSRAKNVESFRELVKIVGLFPTIALNILFFTEAKQGTIKFSPVKAVCILRFIEWMGYQALEGS